MQRCQHYTGRTELAVHDLGQAHICNLGRVVSGQQDVGRLEIKVHNLPGVQEVQASRHIQSYASAQPWEPRPLRGAPASTGMSPASASHN